MSFTRAVLAAFVGGILAIMVVLAWRASQESGKSIPASIPDVPREAQKVYGGVREYAADTVNSGRDTFHKTQAVVKERVLGQSPESEVEEE